MRTTPRHEGLKGPGKCSCPPPCLRPTGPSAVACPQGSLTAAPVPWPAQGHVPGFTMCDSPWVTGLREPPAGTGGPQQQAGGPVQKDKRDQQKPRRKRPRGPGAQGGGSRARIQKHPCGAKKRYCVNRNSLLGVCISQQLGLASWQFLQHCPLLRPRRGRSLPPRPGRDLHAVRAGDSPH